MLNKLLIIFSTIPLFLNILDLIRYCIAYGFSFSYDVSEAFQLSFALNLSIFLCGLVISSRKFRKSVDAWFSLIFCKEDDVIDGEDEFSVDGNNIPSFIRKIIAVTVVWVFIIVVAFLWKTTPDLKQSDYGKSEISKTDVIEAISEKTNEKLFVEYTDEGCFLNCQDGRVVGPFQWICDADFSFPLDDIARYVKSGQFGYISRGGNLITEPIFKFAGKFDDAIARVQTDDDAVFYIDETGSRITRNFDDGENFERQGLYCRVKIGDKYSIIDRNGNVICDGFDSINPLGLVTTYATGVRNGQAMLFEVGAIDCNEEFRIIKTYDYPRISDVKNGEFAYIWDEANNMGVISLNGQVLIEPSFSSIDCFFGGDNNSVENFGGLKNIIFLGTDSDGKISTIYGWTLSGN